MRSIIEYLSTKIQPFSIKATDKTIHQIVKGELDRLGHDADLNHIDTSEVTNMYSLFSDLGDTGDKDHYRDVNPDISKWDVSNVESMEYMFMHCIKFNSDISEWDTRNVKTMHSMFVRCYEFNQDISKWDVRNVEDMRYMFRDCKKFNQDLSRWDVNKVENMYAMFWGCENFNQDISRWNTQNVKYHDSMFNDCPIKEEFKPKFNI